MSSRTRERSASGASVGVAIALFVLLVAVLYFPVAPDAWDRWAGVFVLPVIVFASLPAFARQARREAQPRLFAFLVAALCVKMLFSFLRWYHAYHFVDSAVDAMGYDEVGSQLATGFLRGDFATGLDGYFDTNFIRLLTGGIYTLIRPSSLGGFFIFAWLGFWGTFFFYRAFVLAVPQGNRVSYARWLFFMPSILFWPSSIGKESWLMFGLGIAAYGAAKALTGRFVPGIVITGLGLALTSLVRAPVAAIFGVALVVAGVIRRPDRAVRRMRPLARAGSIVVFAAIGLALYVVLQDYLVRNGFAGGDLGGAIDQAGRVTATGGSEFEPASPSSPTGLLIVSGTVLFRPFLFEARTVEAIVTSIEASLLLLLAVTRFGSIVTAVRNIRRLPYVLLAMLYVGGSIIALSPVANFGIIARQRVLIYPMFLVLLCLNHRREPRVDRKVEVAAQHRTASLVGGRR